MAPAKPAPIMAVGIEAPAAEEEDELPLELPDDAVAEEPDVAEPDADEPDADESDAEAEADEPEPPITVVAPDASVVVTPPVAMTVPLALLMIPVDAPVPAASVTLPVGATITVALAVVATATPVAFPADAAAELSAAGLVASGTRYVWISDGSAVYHVGVWPAANSEAISLEASAELVRASWTSEDGSAVWRTERREMLMLVSVMAG